jgi:hypothetical protein
MRKVSARQLQLIVQLLNKINSEKVVAKPKAERLIKEKTEEVDKEQEAEERLILQELIDYIKEE